MSLSQRTAPSFDTQQATKLLLAFYHKPVAQVSTELFLTIGAVLFFALFAIRPTILTMTELVKEIEDKKETSEALSRKVTVLQTVQGEYFALQDQLYLLDEVIPIEPDPERYLRIIEKVASDNRISISSMQVNEIPLEPEESVAFTRKSPVEGQINLSLTGEYQAIRQFLQTLSEVRPLISLDSISFFKSTTEVDTNTISVSIQLRYHYYGETVAAPTGSRGRASDDSDLDEL